VCLNISLVDLYGDGWDGVELFVGEGSSTTLSSYSPTCGGNPQCLSFCPTSDTVYHLEVSHPNKSYTPRQLWEVVWGVTIDTPTSPSFKGGYGTEMKVSYDANTCEWLVNVWNGTQPNCESCSSGVCPDPPKKKKDKKDKEKKKPETNSTLTAKPKPKYGPPAVNLQIKISANYTEPEDERCGGPLVPSWYLADNTGSHLFHQGMLCNEQDSGYCAVCLGDGSYTIRFIGTPSNSSQVRWDFCGVTDVAPSELTFHVKKGSCYPDAITSPCSSSTFQTHLTLSGDLFLTGYNRELIASSDQAMIVNYLRQILGWDTFQILSMNLDQRPSSGSHSTTEKKNKDDDDEEDEDEDNGKKNKKSKEKQVIDGSKDKDKNHRGLSADFSFVLTYSVDLILEDSFSTIDGKDYSALEALVRSFRSDLPESLSLFNSSSSFRLRSGRLSLEEVEYIGLPQLHTSDLPEPDWSMYTSEIQVHRSSATMGLLNDPLAMSSGILFLLLLVPLVAYLLKATGSGYNTLPDEGGSSHHVPSTGEVYVGTMEMDETLSQRTNLVDSRPHVSDINQML
jgi:hypothetical protein